MNRKALSSTFNRGVIGIAPLVVVGLLLLIGLTFNSAAAEERPPNIVFIMADDLGYAELGCYGQKKIETPRIDSIAKQGIRFTQFYSGSPVCAPARCVLMTGLHSGHAYIRTNREIKPEGQEPIPSDTVTIAELLQARGYVTGAMGKWGLGGPESAGHPNRQGFDRWFGYLCQRHAHNFYPRCLWSDDQKVTLAGNDRGLTGQQYSHDLVTDAALEFIRDNHQQPFFLYVPFTIPHLAIQVPDDSLNEYRGRWPDPPYEGGHGYLPHPAPRAGYAAMVTRMDRDVGRILDLLAELALTENTLICFTSDNGPTFDRLGGSDSDFFASSGPLKGRKGSVWEGGIRVPLVAMWPGQIAPGQSTDHVAAFWDVLPTLVDAAGGEPPTDTDGISFLPTLAGSGDQPRHEYLYWEFPSYGGQQAVRAGNWKVVRRDLFRQPDRPFRLYNLAKDLGETDDVAAENPEIVKRLAQYAAQAHRPSVQFPFPALDESPSTGENLQ